MVHEEMRDQTTADPNRQRYVELSTSKYSGITHTSGIARRGTVRCGVMCGSPVNCICSRCPGHHEARPVPEVVVHECGTPLFLWLHFADPNAGVKISAYSYQALHLGVLAPESGLVRLYYLGRR